MTIKFIPVEDEDYNTDDEQEEIKPLVTQNIDNPLVENVHEVNNFDNAYTESQSDPNPKPKSKGMELD